MTRTWFIFGPSTEIWSIFSKVQLFTRSSVDIYAINWDLCTVTLLSQDGSTKLWHLFAHFEFLYWGIQEMILWNVLIAEYSIVVSPSSKVQFQKRIIRFFFVQAWANVWAMVLSVHTLLNSFWISLLALKDSMLLHFLHWQIFLLS